MVSRRSTAFSTTLSLIAALAASGCGSQFDSETPDPPEGTQPVALQLVASGLILPLYLTAPDGDTRLFIVEKGGMIRIVKDGSLLPIPFLDISGQVSSGSEQGLLGLAFHPQYATNGRFIVHYTDLAGDTRVSGFRVSPDPDVADAASEVSILAEDQPFPNHNGGQVLFGPDGYLYIMLGDGGGADDPGGRGQSLADLLGSILRVEPLESGGYAVPPDNPFVSTAGARPEIWSYGLRNPWRVTFDPATGDLYIADVGQSRWEEVDVSPSTDGAGRGLNFGWSVMEGPECFRDSSCDQDALELPVLSYDHGDGCSITGGFVYRGAAIPALQGHYFYSDYCQGWVRSFRFEDGTAADQFQWPALAPGGGVPSFGRDAIGELYVMSTDGAVFKIMPG
jgi:glucose/arabinose dehydrogenase